MLLRCRGSLFDPQLHDEHALIHEAMGWMFREVGQRVGLAELRRFLEEHPANMPRTTLRYAPEKLPPEERNSWMERRAIARRAGSGSDRERTSGEPSLAERRVHG